MKNLYQKRKSTIKANVHILEEPEQVGIIKNRQLKWKKSKLLQEIKNEGILIQRKMNKAIKRGLQKN